MSLATTAGFCRAHSVSRSPIGMMRSRKLRLVRKMASTCSFALARSNSRLGISAAEAPELAPTVRSLSRIREMRERECVSLASPRVMQPAWRKHEQVRRRDPYHSCCEGNETGWRMIDAIAHLRLPFNSEFTINRVD
ncbi:hypothetical protein KCU99_g384, partial [Aureobasidium melanogenum]